MTLPFPPNFTNAWDNTQPPDTQLANQLGQDLRALRTDTQQRLSLLSGTLANQPANMDAIFGGAGFGMMYFATDTNQVFQWTGVAWVDITSMFSVLSGGLGQSRVVATSNQLGLSAPSTPGAVTIYAVPATGAGLYRLKLYAVATAIGAPGGILTAQLGWTDDQGAHTNNFTMGNPGILGQVLTAVIQGFDTFECIASQNITLNISLTKNGAGTATINIYYRLEYLG